MTNEISRLEGTTDSLSVSMEDNSGYIAHNGKKYVVGLSRYEMFFDTPEEVEEIYAASGGSVAKFHRRQFSSKSHR